MKALDRKHLTRAGAAFAVLGLLAWSPLTPSAGCSQARSKARASEAAADAEALAIRSQELDVLKTRLAELEQKLSTVDAQRARAPEAQATDLARAEPQPLDAAEREARLAQHEATLAAQARAQALDAAWTALISDGIEREITPSSQALNAEAVHCGTTICAVTLTHEYPDAPSELLETLRIKKQDRAFMGEVFVRRVDDPLGGYRTQMFLGREGEALPALDMQPH